MMKKILFLFICIHCIFSTRAQWYNVESLSAKQTLLLKEIEQNITGPEPFELDTPRIDRKTKILHTKDFGLDKNNSPEENALALEKISNSLSNSRSTKLIFPENEVYTVAVIKGKKLLDLINVHDLIVEGNNSRLKFQEADVYVKGKGYLYLDRCERVVIRNLSVGCDWDYKPLALIGEIVQFNEASNEGIYHLVSNGKLSPDMQIWAAQAWDPEARTRTMAGVGSNFKSYKILAPNVLKVVFANKYDSSIVGKYSLVSIKQNTQYSGIVLENNDHILIDNVKFLGIPFMAIEGRDRGMTEHLIIRNCTLAPPEEDTYFSAGEGFDVRASWYICENNRMEHCYDDIMNFDAGLIGAFFAGGLVQEKGLKSNEIIADHLQHYYAKNVIIKGAKMGIADSSFKPIGWESDLESFEYQMNYHKGHSAAHRCILRFKDALPDSIPEDYIIYSPANKAGGYIIRNNVIRNNLRHAIWAGNGNGLIENNIIYQSGYPAIMLQMTSRWGRWFKGYYPNNVIIRGNKILSCNTTLRQPATVFVGGGYDTEHDGFAPIDYGVSQNILIEDNEIIDSYQAALGLWSCQNVIVRNNKITNAFKYPLVSTSRGNGSVFVKKSENVFFINNQIEFSSGSESLPRFVEEDNKDIILQNNHGF